MEDYTYEGTSFYEVYCSFLGKITDDMLLNMTLEDVMSILKSILKSSLSLFQFPKFRINIYDENKKVEVDKDVFVEGRFEDTLTAEEIEIISTLMLIEWINRQITTTQLMRMKYSTQDFKSASQANHIAKMTEYLRETKKQNTHKQRLYNRRRVDEDGYTVSNADKLTGIGNDRVKKQLYTYFGRVEYR